MSQYFTQHFLIFLKAHLSTVEILFAHYYENFASTGDATVRKHKEQTELLY